MLLAFASLFADISTEMLYPVLPIFLTTYLKASGGVVGLVEGVAGATQNISQGFSGYISDRLQRRKPVALVGYLIAAAAKPLIGVSGVWQQALGARFLDRFGSGIRSAPRDALIAGSTDGQNRGRAFGLEGIGDNLGAFLGPLIAIFLLFQIKTDIRNIFYIAFIPGILAFLMIFLLKEKSLAVKAKSKLEMTLDKFPRTYWKYLGVTALFGIGASSNSFLILQTRNLGVSLATTILIYAFFNLVAAFISYPSGVLSDKFGRKNLLLAAFVIFAITYFGFASTKDIYLIGILFIFYGLYQGIFRAIGRTFAADFVPQELAASGVGWYSTVVGMTGLFASIIAGQLWDKVGHEAVFIYGLVFAVIGVILLMLLIPSQHGKRLQES